MGSLVILIVAAAGGIAFLYFAMSNNIVGAKNRVEKAEANIDVILQERYDKMGQLIDVMERALVHEENVQVGIAKMRANYHEGRNSDSVVKADMAFQGVMRDFQATRENYPNIEGLKQVDTVMDEIVASERKLVSSRKTYNRNVTSFKNSCEMFPTSIIANQKGYSPDDYLLFEATAEAKTAPKTMYHGHYAKKYEVKED